MEKVEDSLGVIINMNGIDKNFNEDAKRQLENYGTSLVPIESSTMPWIIPRPTLVRSETIHEGIIENLLQHGSTYPSNLQLALPSSTKSHSSSSTTSSTSKASTKSNNSNTLLLTAANLAKFTFENEKLHHEYIRSNVKNYDTESLASSTHFTLVNGMERKLPKHMKPVKCCCERHQLSILITTMTLLLALTIFFCIYFVQSKIPVSVHLS